MKLKNQIAGMVLRLLVSVMTLSSLLLALSVPAVVPAQAVELGSVHQDATATANTPPHGTSLSIPFPRLGAPYVNADEYPSGDIYVGCCKNDGPGTQGPRSLDPLLTYQFVDVGAGADVVNNPDGSPSIGNSQDFKYLRAHAPKPNNLILVMYIDDREISVNDVDYNMLVTQHPDYLLSDTNNQPLYFDQPASRTLRMLNLSNTGTLNYLKNRVLDHLQKAPTIDGFYVDGNDADLTAQIIAHGSSWGTPANVNETNWHNNENNFLQYFNTIPRDGVNNNPQIHTAVVLANASQDFDNYNGTNVINGSLNTNSVNLVEKGVFSLNRVLYGVGGDQNGYLPDIANSRTPVITNMTVDASPTWQTPSTDNSHDPSVTGQNNYRRMRFGLTTALMGDGFFQYNRDANHPGVYPDASTTWWYDEYNNGQGYNLNNPAQTSGIGYLGNATSNAYFANVTAGLSGAQVLQDSGFENLTGTALNDQWYNVPTQNGAQANFTVETNTANVHSGAKSGLLTVTNPDTGNLGYDYYSAGVAHQSDIPIVSGHHYTLTGYAKSDAVRGVVFKVQGSGGAVYFSSPDFRGPNFSVAPSDGYKQFSYNFTASQSDSKALLLALSGTVAGRLWLDDVKLVDNDSKPDVYERDFQGGTALVNGTDTQVTVQLSKTYKHIAGTQDPSVNNGALATSVTLQPFDGVVLVNGQAAPGCTANCNNVYNLPLLANNAATPIGQTTTYVTFQNLSGSTANITVQYYNINTGAAGTKDTLQIAPKGQQAILPSFGAGNSFGGVISSDQKLNVVVSESLSSGGSAYNVSPSTSSILYSPIALDGQYGGYHTTMVVFNAGSSQATGTIQFFDESGTPSGNTQSFNLAGHSSQTFKQDDPASGLNSSHAYWAKVSGTGSLTAQVIEFGPNNFVATFNALPQAQAQTKIYAPAVFNGGFGYVTGMALANPNSGQATATISYFNANGSSAGSTSLTIPGNGVAGVYQGGPGGPPANFSGSATITSSQSLVTTVNERGGGSISGTYTGLTAGVTSLALPVMANGFAGFITGTTILNIGGAATVTLTYLDGNGNPVGNAQTTNLPANASFQVYQGGNSGLPSGFFGTAIVTSSSPLLATTNALQSGTGLFYTYTEPSN